jgi:Molybdopterin-binding domain of aldehyde dehydrogenase
MSGATHFSRPSSSRRTGRLPEKHSGVRQWSHGGCDSTVKVGWSREDDLRNGFYHTGRGLAVHWSFVSYVAAVGEVAVDSKGTIAVPRIDIAVDCGLFVNPAGVGAQIEGAAVMGATLALKSETHMHLVPRGYDVLPERAWESQECPPLRPPSSTRYMLRWESAYARCRSPNDW